jgi:broad specificity phosphatase PhoE
VTTTLLLVRHGETDWNRDGRVQGHSDIPLNETGRRQAAALRDAMAPETIDAVYASDLERARETALAVASPLGLTVCELPELREKHFGSWEGLTREEIRDRFPHAIRGRWGDGESTDEMAERVLGGLRRIAARHDGRVVLVVSHGGPLRAVQHRVGADPDLPIVNCHVLRVSVEDGEFAQ